MNISPAILYAVLLSMGLAFLVLEVFLPGVIIGIFGGVLVLAAVVFGLVTFPHPWNLWATGIAFVFSTLAVLLWLQLFPKTRAGKRMALNVDAADWKSHTPSADLTGKTGEAVTALRPGGIALLEGRRYDVLAESGEWIAAGTRVRVLDVRDNNIIVSVEAADA